MKLTIESRTYGTDGLAHADNGKAVCPKCGSVFVTMYGLGSVESGPSAEPLQRYTVRKDFGREGVFVITN